MSPEFTSTDLTTLDLRTPEFLSDLVAVAALAVTTTIILWLPGILQA